MRDAALLVADILRAIERIERYAARGPDEFNRDELLQTWMVHHIQIIGEAVRLLPGDFRDRFPQVPWNQIVGMRHTLVHRYFGIDLEIVWSVVVNDIPALRKALAPVLESTPMPENTPPQPPMPPPPDSPKAQ